MIHTHIVNPGIALRQDTARLSGEGRIDILIVDDEPKNLTVLETVLDDPSYRLVRAGSADEALFALVAQEFALIILDIRMPGMTGLELAQMIKERKKTSRVPIIFLTAYYNEDQHMLAGYGTGAVDYLHKPVNPTILRSKVAVFAELYRKNREAVISNRALQVEVNYRRQTQEELRELNETLERRVTERSEALVTARAALHDTGERYRSLFDSSLDAIFSLGLDGRFKAANPAALNLTGRTAEDLQTAQFLDLCAPDQREVVDTVLQAACHSGPFIMETALIQASGSRRDIFISGTPATVDGEAAGVSCIAHDITEELTLRRALQAMNTALESARLAADRANAAKSDFLSSMSHELRTPLNAILGFAQLIHSDSPAPTPSQMSGIDQILTSGWYLLELIDQILDLSQIETRRLTLSLEPTSLAEVMLECQAMIKPKAEQRGVSVTFAGFPEPCFVYADRTRLKQVLINLLSNALKYGGKDGPVAIDCAVAAPQRIRISVRDTGAGLSPDKLLQLFQLFNRLGQETGVEGGTGIGLVLSKRLVEAMGGKIGAESTPGSGTVFWFELNTATAPRPELRQARPAAIAAVGKVNSGPPPVTLLYVDDNPASLNVVEELIARRPDILLLSARDGIQGVQLARARQPDVILMDIQLPGISGIEALGVLREDPATAHIPVIALSANVMPFDIEKGRRAGFLEYLVKPLQLQQLMDALDSAMTAARRSKPSKG